MIDHKSQNCGVFDLCCNSILPTPGADCDTVNFDKIKCVDGLLLCTCNYMNSRTWDCLAGASVSASSQSSVNINGNINSNVLPVSFYGLSYNTQKGPD